MLTQLVVHHLLSKLIPSKGGCLYRSVAGPDLTELI